MWKNVIIGLTGALIGSALSWYVTSYYLGRFMMHGLYMGEIAEVTLNLAVIESIKTGANEKALDQIDKQIQISKIILEGCANDLCRNGKYPEVENTLKSISKYEQSK